MASVGIQSITKGFRAGEDLSSKQYCAVKISADGIVVAAGAGEAAVGIIDNYPASGEPADVVVLAGSKAKIGASVTRGQRLKVASGAVLTPVTADKDFYIAQAMQDGSTNDIIEVIVNPGYYAV